MPAVGYWVTRLSAEDRQARLYRLDSTAALESGHRVNTTKAVLTTFLFFCATSASAQDKEREKEPAAIGELGAVGSWNVRGEGSSYGPTVGLEVTPIKKWLELEAGLTPLFARRSTEWEADLLFKKPWDISKKMEFMLGIGPAWVHTNNPNARRNSISGEAGPDFMFWPSAKHRFGWYVEPSYEYSFARGHEQSIGVTIGLLIGMR